MRINVIEKDNQVDAEGDEETKETERHIHQEQTWAKESCASKQAYFRIAKFADGFHGFTVGYR